MRITKPDCFTQSLRRNVLVTTFCTAFSSSHILNARDPDSENPLTIPGSSSGYNICQPSKSVESGQSRCTLTWVAHSNVEDSARIFIFDSYCKMINAPTTVTSSELNAGYAAESELKSVVVLFAFDPMRPTDRQIPLTFGVKLQFRDNAYESLIKSTGN